MNQFKQRIPSLDGLRAISILMVMGSHATRTADFPTWFEPYAKYFLSGALGVSIFFVISGFLITYLLIMEQNESGRIDLVAFYKRRVLRIFPVLYLFLFATLISTAWLYRDFSTAEWISAATFTRNYFQGNWSLGHLWSISVEEQFYLVWPFALTLLRTQRSLIITALAVIALAPVARILIYISPWSWLGDYAFFTQADSLMFGCLLAILLTNQNGVSSSLNHLFGRHLSLQLFSLALIYLIWLLRVHGELGLLTVPFGTTLQGMGIMCLIGTVVVVRQGFLFRLLNMPFVVWIGVLSYSLYIWQQVILYPGNYPDGDLWWRAFPLNILIAFVVAFISYYGFERPFLKLKDRFATPFNRGQKSINRGGIAAQMLDIK